VVVPKVAEMSEARKAARGRQVESRKRAVAENGVKATAGEVEIYRLKNRATGQVRVLIDARGSIFEGDAWLVRDPETGVTVAFPTRKALGAGYAAADLSGPAKAATPGRKVAGKGRRTRGATK
jgi:hypothetical protein